ncbi:hypothetical protein FACS189421_02730 [Bacteroidia bacterium]|nr:hypothetical protein FACS189421_02730 [Bacteroidia bacterium]
MAIMKKICIMPYALCLAVALCVAGCTFKTQHRGYVFPADIEEKLPNMTTGAAIERELGSPSVKTINGNTVWIYYGVDENYRGPLPLTYDNKRVLLAWLDKNGRVTQTKFLKDADLPDIEPSTDATPIPAEIQLNMIEELINNVGRFTPAGLGQ